jgi:NADH dehydrogenase FAD-containing subunit
MRRSRIVIVGAGFGGLAAIRALRRAPAHVILIDRMNHHVFQPLLYQVATAVLTPGQIGTPIRAIVRKQRNATVILGEVTGVDKDAKRVFVTAADRKGVPVEYDYLIVATGVNHSYFGHNEFAKFAPGLKTLADAVNIRNTVLQTFEQAEVEEDPTRHRDLLTFVLVGAGPTGVELASALAVLTRGTMSSEFRRINPAKARILLVDMAPRVLMQFSESLSQAALKRLETLGVEVRLGHGVEMIDAEGVVIAGERIASKTVIWTAGVAPSPAATWLNAETDHAGRVRVQQNLTVPGHAEILVIGDTAFFEENGKPLPGVAQVAIQQGHYAGKYIHALLGGGQPAKPFKYFDKGSMAVAGRGFAVLQAGNVKVSGLAAWLAWATIHLQFLATSSLRVSVFVQWVLTYLTRQTGSRLIVRHHAPATEPQSMDPTSGTSASPP